jgi:hypothetical protein
MTTLVRPLVLTGLCALGALALAGGPADDLSVDFDAQVDFSVFRTFALRSQAVDSPRPEFDNTLFVKKLNRAIRAALVERKLSEIANVPDLVVDWRVTGEDFNLSQRGTPIPGPGNRGRSTGPQPLRFTQATLVIDLSRRTDRTPIWRGIYRDDESTGSKLVEKLPADAKKLIAKYPPKK